MPVYDLTGRQAAGDVAGELAVVMPIYNEAEGMVTVLSEWKKVLEELGIAHVFVLIDDGSRDGTFKILREFEEKTPGVVVIQKSNSGHGRSCRVGYDISCASQVEWILQIDSDGQCDPKSFVHFWNSRNEADCIFGVRRRRDDGWMRSFTSQVCRWSASLVAGQDLVDPNVPYRLMKNKCLSRALERIPQGFDIHNMALTVVLKGRKELKWKYVDIHFRERRGGRNSINLLGVAQLGFSMLFDLVRLNRNLKKSSSS